MKLTLQQAAERAGVNYEVMKKHIQRGRVKTSTESGRTVVDDRDLDAYIATGAMSEAIERAHGKDSPGVAREFASAIQSMPPYIAQAILDGIPSPTSKKQGTSEPFRKAAEKVPKRGPEDELAAEEARKLGPHCGYPVGHQHELPPRWIHSSASTWTLNGARWSWNGYEWEGSGLREGATLGEGISPADPDADRRPAAPPRPVGKDGKDERPQ